MLGNNRHLQKPLGNKFLSTGQLPNGPPPSGYATGIMLRIARKTILTRTVKSEQTANLYLPITGRLFYQLNYPIFSEVSYKTTRQIDKSNLICILQDNSDPVLFYPYVAARGILVLI